MGKFRGWPPVTPTEAQRVRRAADFLDRYVEASNDLWSTEAFAQPIAGSPYEAACGVAKGRWAFDFARLHLAGSEDHLQTMATIFGSGRLPAYAGYTALRGSLEAAARACWLLDPNLSPRQRQERGFTEHLNNLQGLQKFKRHRESRRKLVVQLRLDAAKAGLVPKFAQVAKKKSSPPPLIGFGIARPLITDLLLALLPHQPTADDDAEGAFLYRLVSGSAHSEPWALLANHERVGFSEPGVAVAALEVHLDVLLPATTRVVKLHDRAIGLHTRLMGHDEAAWQAARGPLTNF